MLNERQKNALALYRKRCKEIKNRPAMEKFLYFEIIKDYKYFEDIISKEDFIEIKRDVRNRANQRYRANKKIKCINNFWKPKIIFGTCTFDDSQFFKKNGKPISERTRTKKVNNWIKRHFVYAVANIDYGIKTEREHHHFVGVLREVESIRQLFNKNGKPKKGKSGYPLFELDYKDYNIGFNPTLEVVEYNAEDYEMKKLSNYLLKINNHENKESTKNRRFRVLK